MPKGFAVIDKEGKVYDITYDGKTVMTMTTDGPMSKRSCPRCQRRTPQRVFYIANEAETTIHLCTVCLQLFQSNKFTDVVPIAFYGTPSFGPKK